MQELRSVCLHGLGGREGSPIKAECGFSEVRIQKELAFPTERLQKNTKVSRPLYLPNSLFCLFLSGSRSGLRWAKLSSVFVL